MPPPRRRNVGLALAIVALFVIVCSSVAGWGEATDAAPDLLLTSKPKEPIESALTVKDESEPWTQVVNHSVDLRVFLGATEKYLGVAQAVDESGTRVGRIEGLAECGDATNAYTGTGDFEWCLAATGLDAGAPMTGKIVTDEQILTIKYSIRDNFWGLPLLVVLVALLLAGVWLWWTTRQLEVYVSHRYLKAVVAKNEAKELDDETKIVGITTEWVEGLANRISAKSLYQMAESVMRLGPGQTEAAKKRLTAAITAAALPDGYAIKSKAEAETEPARKTRIHDFYDDTGNPIQVHPLDKLTASIERVAAAERSLLRLQTFIEQVVPRRKKDVLARLAAHAREMLRKADSEEGFVEVEATLEELRHQAYEAAVEGADADKIDKWHDMGIVAFQQDESAIAAAGTETAGAIVFPSPEAIGRAAVIGTVLVFALLAAVTVVAANYVPNATFGIWSDYLGLFLAVIAASSLTGAITALGLWNLRKPLT